MVAQLLLFLIVIPAGAVKQILNVHGPLDIHWGEGCD